MTVFQKLQAWQDGPDGLDDEQLAKKVRVHRTTISRGKRGLRVLDMKTQLKIQKATGISPADWAEFYAQTVALRGKAEKKSREDAEAVA